MDIRGGLDADLLTDYMAGFDDPRGPTPSRTSAGAEREGALVGLANDRRSIGMESRAFYGNVLFSTGPNQELGGDNDTQCHVDIPMRGCCLFLDDEPILIDGDVVYEEMKAPALARA